MIARLEEIGELDNTLVVVTSDNGMPFPRAKANLYDFGTRMPHAVRWGDRVPAGREVSDFISFIDFAPTFLEAAGLEIPETMSGKSFLDVLESSSSGRVDESRDSVCTGRERHAWCREGLGYPIRALRTDAHLYIRNFEPDRWPAGEGEIFRDIDDGPSKSYMMDQRDEHGRLFDLAFGKRPLEELYDLKRDPNQMSNVADDATCADAKSGLWARLEGRMKSTGDLRAVGGAELWDLNEYYGNRDKPLKRDTPG